jgi:SOS response regulatory protein OraA/RecX
MKEFKLDKSESLFDFDELKRIDSLKTKVLKYVLYKKRTEHEVREKFSAEDENLLDDVIENLKSLNYIDDTAYIEKSVNEYIALKSLSIKEISYKLAQKGIKKSLIDDYICQNKEKMLEYEIQSAKKILVKKMANTELEDVKKFLFQKGYMSETINIAIDELEN